MTTTTPVEQNSDRSEILQVLPAYHAAMVDARIDDLDRLLDKDFSLVHITGYSQPKEEWFAVIRSGKFDYHQIDIGEKTLSIDITDNTAILVGRGIFDATINGMTNDWKLQFTTQFKKHDDKWIIMHALYVSF